MNFFINYHNEENPTSDQQSSCTEKELHQYVGLKMADAIIQETSFCQIGFTIAITNDLIQWKVTYCK